MVPSSQVMGQSLPPSYYPVNEFLYLQRLYLCRVSDNLHDIGSLEAVGNV